MPARPEDDDSVDQGHDGNGEWIFDPDELSLADYLEAHGDE